MRRERRLARPLAVGASAALATLAIGATTMHAHAWDDGPTYTIVVPCAGAGGGAAGLVAAVNKANANGAANPNSTTRIVLTPGCAYVFKSADNGTDGGNALPVVTSRIVIEASDWDEDSDDQNAILLRSQASGTPNFRLVEVSSKGNLTLGAVSVNNGRTPDGTAGSSSTASTGGTGGNGADGGGILSSGTLRLDESTVSGNATGNGGVGGASNGGNGGPGGNGGNGGGIASSGPLTLDDSSVSGNLTGAGGVGGQSTGGTGGTGGNGGSGGGVFSPAGSTYLLGTIVSSNTTGDGGVGGASNAGTGGTGGNGGNGGGVSAPTLYAFGEGVEGNTTGNGGVGGASTGGNGGNGGNGGDGGGTFTGPSSSSAHGLLYTSGLRVLGNQTGNAGPGGSGTLAGGATGRGGNGGGHAAAPLSSLTLRDGSITQNATGSGGQGGAIYSVGSTRTLSNEVIANNSHPQCMPSTADCPS
ncbi:MAG TPA: hypothetical protein VGQ42_14210 [Candidatus Dormibacteraeota bacterium]|jgi:hypothetical protein|nr:hypothetical protein [Candidatus Dormibacteraeota bacterium]